MLQVVLGPSNLSKQFRCSMPEMQLLHEKISGDCAVLCSLLSHSMLGYSFQKKKQKSMGIAHQMGDFRGSKHTFLLINKNQPGLSI